MMLGYLLSDLAVCLSYNKFYSVDEWKSLLYINGYLTNSDKISRLSYCSVSEINHIPLVVSLLREARMSSADTTKIAVPQFINLLESSIKHPNKYKFLSSNIASIVMIKHK